MAPRQCADLGKLALQSKRDQFGEPHGFKPDSSSLFPWLYSELYVACFPESHCFDCFPNFYQGFLNCWFRLSVSCDKCKSRHRQHASAVQLLCSRSGPKFSGLGMACSPSALAFAHKRLASLTILSGLDASEIYDRMLERVRHAVLLIHSFVPRDQADALMPLLDLLTSFQVGSIRTIPSGMRALRWTLKLVWSWQLRFNWP